MAESDLSSTLPSLSGRVIIPAAPFSYMRKHMSDISGVTDVSKC